MVQFARRSLWLVCCWVVLTCGSSGCGGGCTGFQQLPQGTYGGPKLDSAASVRISSAGFGYVNSDAGISTILSLLAPGGTLRVPVPCSIQTTSLLGIPLLQLAIADEGSLFCNAESCGQMDGRCTSADVPREVTININSLHLAPKSPDIVEAAITATVQTGELHIGSVSSSACLLSGGGRIKCTVDFDTARVPPVVTELGLSIQLVIDTKWDRLLSLKVADIEGTRTCSGSTRPPSCIDGADILLSRPAGSSCSLCTAVNFGPVKDLLVTQLANSLQSQLTKVLTEINCAPCSLGACPMSTQAGVSAKCVPSDGGPGKCVDAATGTCVPRLLGIEGRLDVSTVLQGLSPAPAGRELELAFGAGGLVASSAMGTSVGLRGGLREVNPATCVRPKNRPAPVMLPLPDLDGDAPATGYDVAFSISQQTLAETLYRVHQTGALCIELGNETVTQLESGVLSALVPSLNAFTEGKSVPLRVVIRPVNPPTLVIGEGTLDMAGKPLDPLLLLDWPQVEIDVYGLIEDRYARLFTIQVDLKLPLGLDVRGCDQLRPVVGSLMNAVQNVSVKNSELLAESPETLATLVPSLLSLAEPQLAMGLPSITLPELPNFAFKIQLLRARGVGIISGTSNYNHLGIYARLFPSTEMCPVPLKGDEVALWLTSREDATARLMGLGTQEVSFRVDEGFWSMWQLPDAFGQAIVQHPRLRIGGKHVIEVRGADGREGRLELP
jgi:hypothetical protein